MHARARNRVARWPRHGRDTGTELSTPVIAECLVGLQLENSLTGLRNTFQFNALTLSMRVSLPMSTKTAERRRARRRERRKFSPVIPSAPLVLHPAAAAVAAAAVAAVAPPDGAMCIFTDGPIRPPRRLRVVGLSRREEPLFAILSFAAFLSFSCDLVSRLVSLPLSSLLYPQTPTFRDT